MRAVATAPRPPVCRVVSWPALLGCLSGAAARERFLRCYREAGFSPDQFGAVRSAREAAADALSRTEDWLEVTNPGPRSGASAIRTVRARLETELWP
jgi:hypothetical protein